MNVIAHVAEICARRMVQFADKAFSHDTDEAKAFVKKRLLLEIRLLPEKDPNVYPIELNLNRRMPWFGQCNRC